MATAEIRFLIINLTATPILIYRDNQRIFGASDFDNNGACVKMAE